MTIASQAGLLGDSRTRDNSCPAANDSIYFTLSPGSSGTFAVPLEGGTLDGFRVLAEFAQPKNLTFETDIYLFPAALTGCAP